MTESRRHSGGSLPHGNAVYPIRVDVKQIENAVSLWTFASHICAFIALSSLHFLPRLNPHNHTMGLGTITFILQAKGLRVL